MSYLQNLSTIFMIKFIWYSTSLKEINIIIFKPYFMFLCQGKQFFGTTFICFMNNSAIFIFWYDKSKRIQGWMIITKKTKNIPIFYCEEKHFKSLNCQTRFSLVTSMHISKRSISLLIKRCQSSLLMIVFRILVKWSNWWKNHH